MTTSRFSEPLDNREKPVLHLPFGARPEALPPPTPRSSPPRDLPFPKTASPPTPKKPPREPPVGWKNYKQICAEIPPPTFVRKGASMEQWQTYGESLSDRQRQAQAHRWAASICVLFARTFPDDTNLAAFRYAHARSLMIFEAFKQGTRRRDVIGQLQADFAKAQEQDGLG